MYGVGPCRLDDLCIPDQQVEGKAQVDAPDGDVETCRFRSHARGLPAYKILHRRDVEQYHQQ